MGYANTALTIAGSDSGGGAGIQADLKTFAALGVHGVSIITSLTAQNTLGVEAIHDVPLDFIRAQFEAIHKDFRVKAAKTGMLSNKGIIELVAEEAGEYPLVVDPVMVAQSGDRLLEEDAIASLKDLLLPKAFVATPNTPEAEALTGKRIRNEDDMRKACVDIAELGCSVVLKGGHLNAVDVLYHDGRYHVYKGELKPYQVHGAGCTFAAAITAGIAEGRDLPAAVAGAKEFISNAIETSYEPGKGAKVVNQIGPLRVDAERYRVLEGLGRAVEDLKASEKAHLIVPQVGINIAYAMPDAVDLAGVAGIRGRIVRVDDRVMRVGPIEFGATKHVGSMVLEVMKHDPSMRAAMNIRYTVEMVERCEELMDCASFDRSEEPPGVSSMEWGTRGAIVSHGRVPDIIHDSGAMGKEAMIRILGRNPGEVMKKLRRILEQV
ncbi:MAG: bifunctional hydroxymethylpyrimidine kinase/phosphomethylpyrimidine kinase [Candidatus Hydrothermarchaeaceae archaeon]